eukprot:31457-Pelagococcus_subviridis.AAC.18
MGGWTEAPRRERKSVVEERRAGTCARTERASSALGRDASPATIPRIRGRGRPCARPCSISTSTARARSLAPPPGRPSVRNDATRGCAGDSTRRRRGRGRRTLSPASDARRGSSSRAE